MLVPMVVVGFLLRVPPLRPAVAHSQTLPAPAGIANLTVAKDTHSPATFPTMPPTRQVVAIATLVTSTLIGVLLLDRTVTGGPTINGAPAVAPAPPADTARTDSLLALAPLRPGDDTLWLARGLVVRTAPDPGAEAVATVSTLTALEHRELSYEEEAITVRGEAPGWLRIALADGRRGWVARPSDLPIVPLDSVILNSLAYLTPAWDRQVRAKPRRNAAAVEVTGLVVGAEDVPIEVIGAHRNADGLWWHVRILRESPCETAETPAMVVEGWIPAYRDAMLTAEWYSRGC
jgi:hypothetical protein